MLAQPKSKRKRAGFIKNISYKHPLISNPTPYDFTLRNTQHIENHQNQYHCLKKPPLPEKRKTFIGSQQKLSRENSCRSLQASSRVFIPQQKRSFTEQKQEIEDQLAEAKKICDKIQQMRISTSKDKIAKIEKQFSPSPKFQIELSSTKKPYKNEDIIQSNKKQEFREKIKILQKQISDQNFQEYTLKDSFNQNLLKTNTLRQESKNLRAKFLQTYQDYSDEEKLIGDDGTNGFKNTLKESNQFENKKQKNQSGLYSTKGGVCFEFNVNEFSKPTRLSIQKEAPKRTKKQTTKEELLKRRQTAKNYDKVARMKVFGY